MSEPSFTPLLRNEIGGTAVVGIFALFSTFALSSVAIRVIWLAIRRRLAPDSNEPEEYVFFNTQLGHYAVCLLIANLFNGVSGLIGLRWLAQRGITSGGICTLQAFLMQVGNVSTAYFTVTIAVHTFNSLALRIRQSALICVTTITAGWIFAFLFSAGPLMNPGAFQYGHPYGADVLSCGVRKAYPKAQFLYHLLPIFIASVLSAIFYSVVFLVLRGTLNIRGGLKLTLDPKERWVVGSVTQNYHRFVARLASSMLWYPIAYIVLIVPYSITRLLHISGFLVPFGALVFAYVCWFLLGIVNVLLLYNTFRVLGPAFDTTLGSDDKEGLGVSQHTSSLFVDWKGKPHRPLTTHRVSTIASFTSPSPQPSVRVREEQAASMQSFYSYDSIPIGRAIVPEGGRTGSLTSIEGATYGAPAPSLTNTILLGHERHGSVDSLPAPPRRTRSPIVRQSSTEQLSPPVGTVAGTWTPTDRQTGLLVSRGTFGSGAPAGAGARLSTGSVNSVASTTWRQSGISYYFDPPTLSAMNTALPPPLPGSPQGLSRPLPSLPRHSRSLTAVPALNVGAGGQQHRGSMMGRPGASIGSVAELNRF